jgi:hypothetical protein
MFFNILGFSVHFMLPTSFFFLSIQFFIANHESKLI